jgi:peptidoglycan/xylan/chitin deacetylase (PgdA/CDA1 family)
MIITSWDDFSDYDFRLFSLLKRYKIPSIFYIPAGRLIEPKMLNLAKVIVNTEGFEIGSHTVTHTLLTRVGIELAKREIQDSKKILEDKLGVPINSFCYPRGYYNEDVRQAVIDAGYKDARTVKIMNTETPIDPYQTETSIHVLNTREDYEGDHWVAVAIELFDKAIKENGYFHLWGHSLEVERNNEWDNLEWFLKYMSKGIYDKNIQSE